jgi:hypothetical protein
VREVGEHHLVLEIAPDTRVRLAKSAITARTELEGAEEPSEAEDEPTKAPETPLP